MNIDTIVVPTVANWVIAGLMVMTFLAFMKGIVAVQPWVPGSLRDLILFV